MDIKDIRDLIITIDQTSIERVEIEKGDIKIMISKAIANESSNTIRSTNKSDEADYKLTQEKEPVEEKPNEDHIIIKSPIVGTFYSTSSPDSPPFVNIGDIVELGQTICIIEAMKIMNDIKSDVAGEIIEIMVKNDDIVEFGQPLMRMRRY